MVGDEYAFVADDGSWELKMRLATPTKMVGSCPFHPDDAESMEHSLRTYRWRCGACRWRGSSLSLSKAMNAAADAAGAAMRRAMTGQGNGQG